MAALWAHIESCAECRKALDIHNAETPACGDEACSRVAYCPVGAEFRESFKNPLLDQPS